MSFIFLVFLAVFFYWLSTFDIINHKTGEVEQTTPYETWYHFNKIYKLVTRR